MKFRKMLSLFAAAAIAVSSFAGLATTASAAELTEGFFISDTYTDTSATVANGTELFAEEGFVTMTTYGDAAVVKKDSGSPDEWGDYAIQFRLGKNYTGDLANDIQASCAGVIVEPEVDGTCSLYIRRAGTKNAVCSDGKTVTEVTQDGDSKTNYWSVVNFDMTAGTTYCVYSRGGTSYLYGITYTGETDVPAEPEEPVESATKTQVITADEMTGVGNATGSPVLLSSTATGATDAYVNKYQDIFGVDFANITTNKYGYLGDSSRGHLETTFTTTADGPCTLDVLISYARGSNLITVTDSEGNVVLDAVSPTQSEKLGTNGQDLHAYSVTIADLPAGTYTFKWHSESYCSDFLALGVTSATGATEPVVPVVPATQVITADEMTGVGNATGSPVLLSSTATDATDAYVNKYQDIFGVDFANITTSKLGYLGDASRGHVEATFTTAADGPCTLDVLISYARGSNLITVTDSEGNVVLDAVSPTQSEKLGTNGQDIYVYTAEIDNLPAGTYTFKWHSESYCSDFLALGVTSATGATEPEEPGETDEPVEPAAKTNVSVDLTYLESKNILTADEISAVTTVSFGLNAAGERVAADAADAVIVFNNAKYHSKEHGINYGSMTVPVSGTAEIKIGTCAWGSDVIVKDASGNIVATANSNNGACYHNNTTDNVITMYYKTDAATTLTITGGNYLPFVSVKAIDASEIPNDAKVTFDLGTSGAVGTVPEAQTVEIGAAATIPANRTLYVEGSTLTGWTDGTNTYAPGAEVTVTENITLTPVFAANTAKLGDADTTVAFDFQRKSGTPVISFQNNTGFLVYQATIGDAVIDVKIDIDATSGKLANGSWQDWAQVNGGTKFIVPAVEGAVVTMDTIYNNGNYTINGTAYTQAGQTTGEAVTISGAETVEIVAVDPTGSYWRGFTVTYPKAEAPKPEVVNTVIGKFVGANDKSEATAVESEITPNGMSISSIKWTVGDYAGKYEGNISGESKVYFGLVIPDTLDAEVGSVTDEIVTTVE